MGGDNNSSPIYGGIICIKSISNDKNIYTLEDGDTIVLDATIPWKGEHFINIYRNEKKEWVIVRIYDIEDE